MTHFGARCCTSPFHNVSFLHTGFLFIVSEAKSISSHHQDIVGDSCNTWIGSFSFHMDIEVEHVLRTEPAGDETYGRKWKKWRLVSVTNSCEFWQGSLIYCQTTPGWEAGKTSLSLVWTPRFAWGKNLLTLLSKKLLGGSEFFITGYSKEMVCNLHSSSDSPV